MGYECCLTYRPNKEHLDNLCRPRFDAAPKKCQKKKKKTIPPSGASGLEDSVFAVDTGSRGFDSDRRHMSERIFRTNRPGYSHPVCSELENSGIRVAVGDCSVTERRRWCPPYQTDKTVHVHVKTLQHNEDGRTAPDVRGHGSVTLSH